MARQVWTERAENLALRRVWYLDREVRTFHSTKPQLVDTAAAVRGHVPRVHAPCSTPDARGGRDTGLQPPSRGSRSCNDRATSVSYSPYSQRARYHGRCGGLRWDRERAPLTGCSSPSRAVVVQSGGLLDDDFAGDGEASGNHEAQRPAD